MCDALNVQPYDPIRQVAEKAHLKCSVTIAHNVLIELIEELPKDILNENIDLLSRLYSHFKPTPPKCKNLLDWVLHGLVEKKYESSAGHAKYLYANGETIVAHDGVGRRIYKIKQSVVLDNIDGLFPNSLIGFYDRKFYRIDLDYIPIDVMKWIPEYSRSLPLEEFKSLASLGVVSPIHGEIIITVYVADLQLTFKYKELYDALSGFNDAQVYFSPVERSIKIENDDQMAFIATCRKD